MKVLSAVLFSLLFAPLTALATSATMSKLWDWFVAVGYGPGPSNGAWYGLAVILGVATAPALANLTHEKQEGHPVALVFSRIIGILVACAITLGVAWLVGTVTGWKA